MSNKDLFGFDTERRVLTLRIVIQDQERAKWIWENHMNGAGTVQDNGIHVTGIANGDLFEEVDRLEAELEKAESEGA